MKQRELVRILEAHGCHLLREGARHSVFCNPKLNRVSSVPRHAEIKEALALKIIKDLGARN